MLRKIAVLTALVMLLTALASAQGLATTATKDDWEEINFEFNSHILSDGYPSLLRIAELLNKNPGYKVKVEGHTDWVGSHPYNNKLALRRANTVKDFLVKYGANPNQISVSGEGKRNPKVDNKTKEGRFMNRRVVLTVTDDKGNMVGAGGPNEVIKAIEKLARQQEECCSQILKRLDKLDEILAMLRELKNDNEQMKKEIAALREGRGAPAAAAGVAPAATTAAAAPATRSDVSEAVEKALTQTSLPRFSLLGLNIGPDGNGNLAATGRGRFFAPFRENFAFQGQGEFLYWDDRKEGQIDFGLVTRYKPVQLGGFASFKHVRFDAFQQGGTLGQTAFTLDYIFKYGKVGAFGTKAFLDEAVIGRRNIGRNIIQETYLGVVDQVGGSGTVALGSRAWLEGNLGYLRRRGGHDKPGGTLRLVFPLNNRFAFTAEGGVNETLVGNEANGRAVFGILFGNFLEPRRFASVDHPVPVDIPRVRYELLTRTNRTGNDPPVADAGPDQIGVAAGTIRLDGSGSFDPDGDPITFAWSQIAGPSVTLANATTANPTFTAQEGNIYSFRLTVTDRPGARSIARVTVSTRETPRVRIVRFDVSPFQIRQGEKAVLNYLVENADSVTITGVSGTLNPRSGSIDVSASESTSFTLTAKNAVSEDSATVVLSVERPQPRLVSCSASPATIRQGESSTISWQSQNADSVEVIGVGTFGPSGSAPVSPQQSTVYTLVARSAYGETTCTAGVNVIAGSRPMVIRFSANPVEILEGDASTLTWQTENADTVTISGLGNVQPNGSAQVTPATTTTYTLTARNQFGESSATATVTVIPKVKIISFTVNPTTIARGGQQVTLTWQTENAVELFIDNGIGPRPVNGSLSFTGPVKTTTYTLTAIGRGSQAQASVTVTLDTSGTPPVGVPTAVVCGGGDIVTALRDLYVDASCSFHSAKDTLTYSWRSVDGRGEVLTPNAARALVKLKDTYYGDFRFEVTVTDSKGNISKATVRVTLVQARPLF